jgi:hypothetical protein
VDGPIAAEHGLDEKREALDGAGNHTVKTGGRTLQGNPFRVWNGTIE